MVERIRTLLETRQLTTTQFADAIGIARPIVSHILSGRNKPSLEVVQRILAAMPDLSMPWLLNGTGPMLATAVQEPTTAQEPTAPSGHAKPPSTAENGALPAADTLVPRPEPIPLAAPAARWERSPRAAPVPAAVQTASTPRPALKRFTGEAPKPASAPQEPLSAPPIDIPEMDLVPVPPAAPFNATPPEPGPADAAPVGASVSPTADFNAAALFAQTEKPIRRIVIFYRDGSFADYQPE